MAISAKEPLYACPTCGVGLRRLGGRAVDLFCRKCGTAVALNDDGTCFYLHRDLTYPRGWTKLERLPWPAEESEGRPG